MEFVAKSAGMREEERGGAYHAPTLRTALHVAVGFHSSGNFCRVCIPFLLVVLDVTTPKGEECTNGQWAITLNVRVGV